jgi:hypothetical protein
MRQDGVWLVLGCDQRNDPRRRVLRECQEYNELEGYDCWEDCYNPKSEWKVNNVLRVYEAVKEWNDFASLFADVHKCEYIRIDEDVYKLVKQLRAEIAEKRAADEARREEHRLREKQLFEQRCVEIEREFERDKELVYNNIPRWQAKLIVQEVMLGLRDETTTTKRLCEMAHEGVL